MGDEQEKAGTAVLPPRVQEAVDAEVTRILERAHRAVRGSYANSYGVFLYRIMRDAKVGVTRDRWLAATGGDVSSLPETDQQHRAAIRVAGRQPVNCCDRCRRDQYETLVREGLIRPVVDEDDEDDEPGERTCQCGNCPDDYCQGDCDRCEDHDCEQCYRGHYASACCGYCEECDTHQGTGRDEVCDRGHCHECDHNCDTY